MPDDPASETLPALVLQRVWCPECSHVRTVAAEPGAEIECLCGAMVEPYEEDQ